MIAPNAPALRVSTPTPMLPIGSPSVRPRPTISPTTRDWLRAGLVADVLPCLPEIVAYATTRQRPITLLTCDSVGALTRKSYELNSPVITPANARTYGVDFLSVYRRIRRHHDHAVIVRPIHGREVILLTRCHPDGMLEVTVPAELAPLVAQTVDEQDGPPPGVWLHMIGNPVWPSYRTEQAHTMVEHLVTLSNAEPQFEKHRSAGDRPPAGLLTEPPLATVPPPRGGLFRRFLKAIDLR